MPGAFPGQGKVLDSPGTGVIRGCELPCRCSESHLGPLQEQQEFLTTEPSLKPQTSPLLSSLRYSVSKENDMCLVKLLDPSCLSQVDKVSLHTSPAQAWGRSAEGWLFVERR